MSATKITIKYSILLLINVIFSLCAFDAQAEKRAVNTPNMAAVSASRSRWMECVQDKMISMLSKRVPPADYERAQPGLCPIERQTFYNEMRAGFKVVADQEESRIRSTRVLDNFDRLSTSKYTTEFYD